MMDGREVVRRAYDSLGPRYGDWTQANDPKYRERYLDLLDERLIADALVVELGSGTGIPAARRLAERHRVVCVDFAAVQLALVRQNVPEALCVRSDIGVVAFAPQSLDAVVAFYSIIHVPREEHRDVFVSVAGWLRPGGWFAASLGAQHGDPGSTDGWIDDVEMYWSFFDADTNLEMICDAGLEIVRSEVLENFEDERDAQFLWVLARKP